MGQSLVKEYINILSKVEDSCVKKITAGIETYVSFSSLVNLSNADVTEKWLAMR